MEEQPIDPSRTRNLGITGITALTGCISLVIIFVALFIGLTIDRLLGVRGPATICLLVLSVPVSLFLMIQVALRLVRQVEPSSLVQKKTSQKSFYGEKEE
jgi:ABC-type protease/lipase transport system fused ATPase/permease subunit